MVQLSIITLGVASVLSSLAAAKSCKTGGIYCGTDLLRRGDYITKINTNLLANGLPTSSLYVQQSLWACIEHGDIKFLQFCVSGCVGGDSKDDYCTGTGKRDEIVEDVDEDVVDEDVDDEDVDDEDDIAERDIAVEWKA